MNWTRKDWGLFVLPYHTTNKLPWFKRFAEWCKKHGKERIILDRDGVSPYLKRYYLIPRWLFLGLIRVVIHKFERSDDDSAWHDHRWPFLSIVLSGGYWEHRPNYKTKTDEKTWRKPGSIAIRKAKDFHYIELESNSDEVWTLFIMLTPAYRDWSFMSFDFKTITPWREYLKLKLKN